MSDSLRDVSKDRVPTAPPTSDADHTPSRLVKWENEPSRTGSPLQVADAPASPNQPPGSLTVHFDPSKGLDKAVGSDVVHLTIDSPHGVSLATNMVYGVDAQGREIPLHYQTIVSSPDDKNGTALRGGFDVPATLQDVTLHYTDKNGIIHDQTYPASALRLEGDAGVITPHVNDFKKPDDQRPVSQQYPDTTSVYEYGYRLSDISGKVLGFMEQNLVNDKQNDKTGNPFIDINLAETRVGLAVRHYMNSFSTRYNDQTRAQEKQFAMMEIEEAKKDYDSAMTLGQKKMQALPNPGDPMPHNQTDPLGRRFFPEPPYGQDYLPKIYGAAIDTANWRKAQLNWLESMMSGNRVLPPRQSNRIDQP